MNSIILSLREREKKNVVAETRQIGSWQFVRGLYLKLQLKEKMSNYKYCKIIGKTYILNSIIVIRKEI